MSIGVAGANSITNSGTINGFGGITLQSGTIVNQAGGTIAGTGNDGSISADAIHGVGAIMVINHGTLTSFSNAFDAGAGSTLDNSGTINSVTPSGAAWEQASTSASAPNLLTNTGSITGGTRGARFLFDGSVVNAGTITGSTSAGVEADAGALSVTNNAGGTITGATNGVVATGGALTLLSAGTIKGSNGTAIVGDNYANSVTLKAGSVTTGGIALGSANDTVTIYNGQGTGNGGTLAAATVGAIDLGTGTNTLTLAGAGDGSPLNGVGGTLASSSLSGITSLVKQDAGVWTLTGTAATGAIGAITISGGTLVAASNGALGNAGVTDNAMLQFNGASGAVGNAVSGTGTIGVLNVGTGNTLTFNGALTNTGGMLIGDGSTVAINASEYGGILENGAGARTLTITSGSATNSTANTFGSGLYINTTSGTTTVGVSSGATLATTATSGSYPNAITALSTAAITNRGTISASYGAGATISGSSTVDNFGMITGGSSATAGIGVQASGTSGVTNESGGTITAAGTSGVGLSGSATFTNLAGGTVSYSGNANQSGAAVSSSGGNTITNLGLISMTGSSGQGIIATAGGTITNGSTTNATARVTTTASGAFGSVALLSGNATTTVTNYGRLDGSAGGLIQNSGTGALVVNNLGAASIIDSGYAAVQGGSGGVMLVNAGKVVGGSNGVYTAAAAAVSNAGTIGTGTVDANGAFAVGGSGFAIEFATGAVTNTGTINSTAAGIYQTSTAGTLNLVNTGTIGGAGQATDPDDTVVATGSAMVLNSGTITTPNFYGVALNGGGTVTNAAAGQISGGTAGSRYGVFIEKASGTVNNYGSITSTDAAHYGILFDDHAATINLYAGSTTGTILTGSANDTLTLYNGQVNAAAVATTYADAVTGATAGTITLQNAGTIAAATVGAVNLGGGTNTLVLRGTGDGVANGAAGSFSLTGGAGITVLTKQDAGTWTLTGNTNAGLTRINAGTDTPSGLLIFANTNLTSDIYVNGATIRATGAGGFGSGTIYAVDPTMQYAFTTTYGNAIVLQTADATNDPTRLQVGDGITATITGQISQGAAGTNNTNSQPIAATQPLIYELIAGATAGTFVLTNGANNYNGLTTINAGTTVQEHNTLSALGTGGTTINGGAVLQLDNQTGGILYTEGGTIGGAGTLRFTGNAGSTTAIGYGGNGNTVVSLASGGLIDVVSGTVNGSSSSQGFWTGNKGNLAIASGAIFDGVEGTIIVNALTGAGTLRGGYGTSGSTTIGVDNGSGTFTGTITNSINANSPLVLIKQGTGTETLTGVNTYTGATTISGGTLALKTAGSIATTAVIDNATLDISGLTNGGATIKNLTGNGTVALGGNKLTLASASTFNGTITDGGIVANTGGQVEVGGGGTYVFGGANSYTGTTTIDANTTLQGTTATLSPSSTVVDNGTLAFVQTASGSFSPGVSGTGVVTVSGLASSGGPITFNGALTNAGGLVLGTGGYVIINGSVSNASVNGAVQVTGAGDVLTVASGHSVTSTQTANADYASAIYGTGANFVVNNAGTINAPRRHAGRQLAELWQPGHLCHRRRDREQYRQDLRRPAGHGHLSQRRRHHLRR